MAERELSGLRAHWRTRHTRQRVGGERRSSGGCCKPKGENYARRPAAEQAGGPSCGHSCPVRWRLCRAHSQARALLLGAYTCLARVRRGRRSSHGERSGRQWGNERGKKIRALDGEKDRAVSGRSTRRADEGLTRAGVGVGERRARGTERKVLRERRTAPWRWPLRGNRTAARSGKIEDLCETPFTSINATLCCPPCPLPVTYLKIAIARFSTKSEVASRGSAIYLCFRSLASLSTYRTIDSQTFDRISSIDICDNKTCSRVTRKHILFYIYNCFSFTQERKYYIYMQIYIE